MGPHARYEQLWRELQLADELGFDYGFAVEHHFTPYESWMSSPNLYAVAGAARTKNIRLGAMGHIVPLHHPVRLLEEIALTDQLTGGRIEVGLVPGIVPTFFEPFKADFEKRREVTLEFARFMKAAYAGDGHVTWNSPRIPYGGFDLSVMPLQRPHPPMWMETRDVATLEFCAREGIHAGYFLIFPRAEAKVRYAPYIAGWKEHGWPGVPNIAYSCVVYVDETDQKALDTGLPTGRTPTRASFRTPTTRTKSAAGRSSNPRSSKNAATTGRPRSCATLLDPQFLLEKDLILIGSPDTVAAKLRRWAQEGSFNTFFGEFNFGNLAEADIMRSLRLFGTEVIPKLRGFEPY